MGYSVLASLLNKIPIITVQNTKFPILTRLATCMPVVGHVIPIPFESRLVCPKASPFLYDT